MTLPDILNILAIFAQIILFSALQYTRHNKVYCIIVLLQALIQSYSDVCLIRVAPQCQGNTLKEATVLLPGPTWSSPP